VREQIHTPIPAVQAPVYSPNVDLISIPTASDSGAYAAHLYTQITTPSPVVEVTRSYADVSTMADLISLPEVSEAMVQVAPITANNETQTSFLGVNEITQTELLGVNEITQTSFLGVDLPPLPYVLPLHCT
jgi:hypothetical protein